MFGENLRTLSQRYPSVSELSRQLSINRTQFNRYLSGESFPRPDVLDRICGFFNVDARILLDPVDDLVTSGMILNGPTLSEFSGPGVNDISQETFPDGFYRFSRRSFTNADRFVVGIVRVFRRAGHTYVRGFEAKEAMREQGQPTDPRSREFRGYISRQDDGVALVISRRKAMSSSFNYLARVASFENNFWVGYVTRTVRENANSARATRMVYEHLKPDCKSVLDAARGSGFRSADSLMPYHRRLLQIEDPFR
jgi:transcriptional regulator with XRE-family HTH domain